MLIEYRQSSRLQQMWASPVQEVQASLQAQVRLSLDDPRYKGCITRLYVSLHYTSPDIWGSRHNVILFALCCRDGDVFFRWLSVAVDTLFRWRFFPYFCIRLPSTTACRLGLWSRVFALCRKKRESNVKGSWSLMSYNSYFCGQVNVKSQKGKIFSPQKSQVWTNPTGHCAYYRELAAGLHTHELRTKIRKTAVGYRILETRQRDDGTVRAYPDWCSSKKSIQYYEHMLLTTTSYASHLPTGKCEYKLSTVRSRSRQGPADQKMMMTRIKRIEVDIIKR